MLIRKKETNKQPWFWLFFIVLLSLLYIRDLEWNYMDSIYIFSIEKARRQLLQVILLISEIVD